MIKLNIILVECISSYSAKLFRIDLQKYGRKISNGIIIKMKKDG